MVIDEKIIYFFHKYFRCKTSLSACPLVRCPGPYLRTFFRVGSRTSPFFVPLGPFCLPVRRVFSPPFIYERPKGRPAGLLNKNKVFLLWCLRNLKPGTFIDRKVGFSNFAETTKKIHYFYLSTRPAGP